MAISYQSGFNSGELSPKLKGRSELDVYRNGCSRLENFLVLPQGGVERRPGTTYIGKTADLTFDAWDDATAYSTGNKVSSGGNDYICTVSHVVSAWVDTSDYFIDSLATSGGVTYICTTAHAISDWADSILYTVDSLVSLAGVTYICEIEHTGDGAGNNSPDVDATNWTLYTAINQSDTDWWAVYDTINDADASQNFFSLYTIPTAGSEKCRFIPFVFSSSEAYAVEIGNGYAKVWNPDGTYTNVSGTIPYGADDVSEIDYYQRFDILYLASPSYPIQELVRTDRTPTFRISEIEYDYPPALDENDGGEALTPTALYDPWRNDAAGVSYLINDVVRYDGSDYIALTNHSSIAGTSEDFFYYVNNGDWELLNETSSWQIVSDTDIFTEDWEGVHLVLRHDRSIVSDNIDGVNWEGGLLPGQEKVISVSAITSYTASWYGKDAPFINTGTAALYSDGVLVASGKQWSYTGSASSEIKIVALSGFTGAAKVVTTSGSGVASDFGSASGVSDALNVSYSNWTVITGDTWTGRIVIERKTDGKEWREYVVLGDTTGGTANNFSYSSPLPESKNTFIRLRYTYSSGLNCTYSIQGDNGFFTSSCKITNYVDAKTVDVNVISFFEKISPTTNWSMGSFGPVNGYPRSISFHEDRMWLVGSDLEPATIYASTLGDYYNFLPGAEDDSSIRRIPTSAEQAEWLIGKRYLFAGTEGGTLLISSSNRDDITTPANIKTEYQSVFGASSITPVLANDVVVYAQKNGLKLREMIYSYEEENFRSNDLNILSDSVLSPGVIEMNIQKQPDQTIWAIKSDGNVALLAYERGQEIVGWSRWETDGDVISACVTPASGEDDTVWLIVKRNDEYLVETVNPRSATGKFVDSSVTATTTLSADNVSVTYQPWSGAGTEKVTINSTAHSLSTGDYVKFSDSTGCDYFNAKSFRVEDTGANTFDVMVDAVDYVLWPGFMYPLEVTATGSNGTEVIFSRTGYDATGRPELKYNVEGYVDLIIGWDTGDSRWELYDNGGFGGGVTLMAYNVSTEQHFPKTGWTWVSEAPSNRPQFGGGVELDWNGGSCVQDDGTTPATTVSYVEAVNTLSGLDHLDGDTVQVLANGEYIGDYKFQTWATATDYEDGDIVWDTDRYYQASEDHTSSALFATDSAKWDEYDTVQPEGTIFLDDYYSMITAGLGYESIMRTMPIEPALGNRLPNSRVKNVNQVVIKFFETIGAKVGTLDKTLTSLSSKRTYDEANEAIDVFSGDVDFNIPGDWRREKIVEVKQDAPYPMTILSLSAWTEVKGG